MLITLAKFLFPSKVEWSQVTNSRTWTYFGVGALFCLLHPTSKLEKENLEVMSIYANSLSNILLKNTLGILIYDPIMIKRFNIVKYLRKNSKCNLLH